MYRWSARETSANNTVSGERGRQASSRPSLLNPQSSVKVTHDHRIFPLGIERACGIQGYRLSIAFNPTQSRLIETLAPQQRIGGGR